jgi:hypothetical protein
MELQHIRDLLSTVSTERSNWEYKHFFLERTAANWPRQVVSQLKELRRIIDTKGDLERIGWTSENQTLRDELTKQEAQVEEWLKQYTEDEIKEAIADYENAEAEYWPTELGRRAAIDILSTGKISKEVTELALLLEEEDFRTYVKVCGDIASTATLVSQEVQADSLPEELPR